MMSYEDIAANLVESGYRQRKNVSVWGTNPAVRRIRLVVMFRSATAISLSDSVRYIDKAIATFYGTERVGD